MRLYKKAVVCLLAAAMALSMLTACGGGEPASSGSTSGGSSSGGNPETSTVLGPEQFEENVSDGEAGTGTVGTPVAFSASSYAAFANQLKAWKSTGIYVELTVAEFNANKALKRATDEILAADRNSIYMKMAFRDTLTKPTVLYGTVENNVQCMYTLYDKSKVAVRQLGATQEDELWEEIGFSEDQLPYQIYQTTVKVNGHPYKAETFTDFEGGKHTICYEGNQAKYLMDEGRGPDSDGVKYRIVEFKTVQNNTRGLCRSPQEKGYTIYTMKGMKMSEDNRTVSIVYEDEAGKKYTLTATEGPGSFKVTDEAGNDVTSQFRWLTIGE